MQMAYGHHLNLLEEIIMFENLYLFQEMCGFKEDWELPLDISLLVLFLN